MSMRKRLPSPGNLAGIMLGIALLAGCSGNELSSADRLPTTTTTPRAERDPQRPGGSTAPPTSSPSSAPGSTAAPTTEPPPEDLPGLWISLGVSVNDERGTEYATASSTENLRAPIDDGQGGVIYLRCEGDVSTCAIERVTEPKGKPQQLGSADDLLAVGTMGGKPVLVTAWVDPTVQPDFTTDTSGRVARVISLDTGTIVTTFDWYGWESGPFALDVEQDRFVLCQGEGLECQLTVRVGDGAAADQPVEGVPAAEVTSLALDPTGDVLTWVSTDSATGATTVQTRTFSNGASTTAELLRAEDDQATDTDTNGAWVAMLVGDRIKLRQVGGTGQTGQLVAPPGVLSIALRSDGAAAAGEPSPL